MIATARQRAICCGAARAPVRGPVGAHLPIAGLLRSQPCPPATPGRHHDQGSRRVRRSWCCPRSRTGHSMRTRGAAAAQGRVSRDVSIRSCAHHIAAESISVSRLSTSAPPTFSGRGTSPRLVQAQTASCTISCRPFGMAPGTLSGEGTRTRIGVRGPGHARRNSGNKCMAVLQQCRLYYLQYTLKARCVRGV